MGTKIGFKKCNKLLRDEIKKKINQDKYKTH